MIGSVRGLDGARWLIGMFNAWTSWLTYHRTWLFSGRLESVAMVKRRLSHRWSGCQRNKPKWLQTSWATERMTHLFSDCLRYYYDPFKIDHLTHLRAWLLMTSFLVRNLNLFCSSANWSNLGDRMNEFLSRKWSQNNCKPGLNWATESLEGSVSHLV